MHSASSTRRSSDLDISLAGKHVLYKYVKMDDGHSLITEAHQRGHMGSVDIVIPNTPESETMVAMMNKQLPA